MAQDEKEDVRDSDEADAKDGASEESNADKAADKADKHVAERSAAKAHVEAKERTEKAVGASHAADHGHGGGHHKPNRKEYMVIFVVLFVLTVLEVAVAQIPGIAKGLLTLALVSLAVTKAAFVGLFYMHLKQETKILRLTVAIPFSAPVVYALALIADAAWRLTR
jgi:cytochrome c oxidase subunit IV